jgi:hypothetical protein
MVDAEAFEKEIQQAENRYSVLNNPDDLKYINADQYTIEINKNWLKRLHQDIYVGEAYQILADYINQITQH